MGSGVNNRDVLAHDVNGFVNDDWRVTNRLTLTLGVRYDYFSPFTESRGRFVGFDPDRLTTVQFPAEGRWLRADSCRPPTQESFAGSPAGAIVAGFA